jgi:putative PEP-CTERM system histidine kinase
MSPVVAGISFLSAAGAFVALALYLRPSRLAVGAPRLRLRIAALGTAIWALLAWAAVAGLLPPAAVLVLELLLLSIWLWQLESFAEWQGQPRWFRQMLRWGAPLTGVVSLLWLVAMPVPDATLEQGGRAVAIAGLLWAVLGLFALEQIYRNAAADARRALRWFCLGVGSLFVIELISFAELLLFSNVPVGLWVARGALFAGSALALLRAARHMPDWSVGVAFSRQAAFYTSSFVAVGGYLLLLSLVGMSLSALPEVGRGFAQLVLWSLGLVSLAFALFSETLRRRLRVFIASHFFAQRYDYRAEWLRFIRTLSAQDGSDSLPKRAIRALAQIVESPRGALWTRVEVGTAFSCIERWGDSGADERLGALDPVAPGDPLVGFLERTGWLVDLREYAKSPHVYHGLSMDPSRYSSDPAGLIVPLLRGERLYGWVALSRAPALGDLNFEDRDLLKTAGRQIAVHLSQYDADAKLAEAQQFEAYNRMTAFVMHDLKNIAAQLKLISQNAERHRRNPEFVDDAMRTIASSAARMTKLIGQLAAGAQGGEPQPATMQTVDLATLAERAALRCGGRSPVPQVVVQARPTVFVESERLASVIEHAIRNAQDATPESGEIVVEVNVVDRQPLLAIVDNGTGMDEAFVRDRLFRPFDTTKGARGMGIGAFQIREYLRSLGGRVDVQSTPGRGTRFEMWFPVPLRDALALKAG